MAFLRNEGFFVFLYGKVVVPLQWISRETEKSVVFDMVEKINKNVNIFGVPCTSKRECGGTSRRKLIA